MQFRTKSVHQGVSRDTEFNSVITPIYPTSTFRFNRLGEHNGFDYTRSGNPTRLSLEENLAALEGGVKGYCTCTGMAAVTAVLHLLNAGDHVVAGNDIYAGTYRLMSTLFTQLGVKFDFVDMRDLEKTRKALRSETKMVWLESPSNPLMNIIDIKAICQLAHQAGSLVAVDNTFATPYLQRPLELGGDIIIHSTTKYINGHSDVVGGAVILKEQAVADKVFFNVNALGLGESPFDAWLVLRGVKTLAPRMEIHNSNAGLLAEFLEQIPTVQRVHYPGLKSHPGHELASRQMSGFGGMLSFELDLARISLDTFFEKLRFFALAESLGGVESLIESPWFMSHASIPEEARREGGITPGLVRISVGIEDPDDLRADLEQALR